MWRYFTARCRTDVAHRPSAVSSAIAAARAGFFAVLITLGDPACAVDRSVLARNLFTEAVFRLVDRDKSRVSPGEVSARYGEHHFPPLRR